MTEANDATAFVKSSSATENKLVDGLNLYKLFSFNLGRKQKRFYRFRGEKRIKNF